MPAISNPAITALLRAIDRELIFADVLIRRAEMAFDLRHVRDAAAGDDQLTPVAIPQLRELANHDSSGRFRPLKSAPDLRSGWRARARDSAELELALNHLYPGAVADWHAAQSSPPPITGFREFTERQTGMYRITHKLSDDQAATVIRAGCHSRHCLKRRLWSVPGLPPDDAAAKSVIPCLEPCAVLLEFARKSMRVEQEDQLQIQLAKSDWQIISNALDRLASGESPGSGAAADPSERRRLQWIIQKLQPQLDR